MNFEFQEYRKNLAEKIKNTPSKKERRRIIEDAQQNPHYHLAYSVKIAEKNGTRYEDSISTDWLEIDICDNTPEPFKSFYEKRKLINKHFIIAEQRLSQQFIESENKFVSQLFKDAETHASLEKFYKMMGNLLDPNKSYNLFNDGLFLFLRVEQNQLLDLSKLEQEYSANNGKSVYIELTHDQVLRMGSLIKKLLYDERKGGAAEYFFRHTEMAREEIVKYKQKRSLCANDKDRQLLDNAIERINYFLDQVREIHNFMGSGCLDFFCKWAKIIEKYKQSVEHLNKLKIQQLESLFPNDRSGLIYKGRKIKLDKLIDALTGNRYSDKKSLIHVIYGNCPMPFNFDVADILQEEIQPDVPARYKAADGFFVGSGSADFLYAYEQGGGLGGDFNEKPLVIIGINNPVFKKFCAIKFYRLIEQDKSRNKFNNLKEFLEAYEKEGSMLIRTIQRDKNPYYYDLYDGDQSEKLPQIYKKLLYDILADLPVNIDSTEGLPLNKDFLSIPDELGSENKILRLGDMAECIIDFKKGVVWYADKPQKNQDQNTVYKNIIASK